MKRFGRLAGVAAGLAMLVAGCATVADAGRLSVSVTQVVPMQASLLETAAAVTLRLTNETAQALALQGGSHRLYLNGTSVGRAVSNERVTVPQLGTVTQTVTVHLETLTLIRLATELSQKKVAAVSYRLESTFHPVEGQGGRNLRATSTGELDLSALTSMEEAPAKR